MAVLVAVLGIVLAVYWPALSAGALYMDDKFYVGTALMRNPSWASVKAIFGDVLAPSGVNGYYQPLSQLSIMLDFLDPTAATNLLPFHRTTLLLHMVNVGLVVGLLALLFGNWITAGLLGLVYGLHPLNADAVLWVAERKTVLSTGFALCALILYVTYARRTEQESRIPWKRYLASLFLYGCALLSKPTALPVVALLVLLDYWPLNRRFTLRTWLEKVPFLLVAVLSAVITIISQARSGYDGSTEVMNLLYVPLVASYCVGFYLFKTIWPVGLVADYPPPHPLSLANPHVLFAVIAAAAALGVTLFAARRTRALVGGGLFFLVAIAPALGIVRFTSSIAANRSMYLPMVGLLLPLASGLRRWWSATESESRTPRVAGRRLAVGGLAAILAVGSAIATRQYESHWRDSVTLLRYYLSQEPRDWKLNTRLGNEWIQRGDYPQAISAFKDAAQLNPNWAENHLNLGRALFTVGNYEEARRSFTMALQRTPEDWRAHMLMGMTLVRQEDPQGALGEFRTAARLAPTKGMPHYNIANVLSQQGKSDQAAAEYREALRLEPQNGEARRALDALGAQLP